MRVQASSGGRTKDIRDHCQRLVLVAENGQEARQLATLNRRIIDGTEFPDEPNTSGLLVCDECGCNQVEYIGDIPRCKSCGSYALK
jgi:hypothetical protein